MPIVVYTPDMFDSLRRAAGRMRMETALAHREFVNAYYAGSGRRLFLFLGETGEVEGTVGVETMRFEHAGEEMLVAAGSNFHSLASGVGGLLFRQWVREAPVSLVFGGSPDTHRILESQKWTYYPGVKTCLLNRRRLAAPGDSWFRRLLLRIFDLGERFRSVDAGGLGRRAEAESLRDPAAKVEIEEERDYAEDLRPARSDFVFRYAPTVDCLRSRYNPEFGFVRYRIFRLLSAGRSAGYVVIQDGRSHVLVSHGDAEDCVVLARGVLKALVEVTRRDDRPREILLSTSHPVMRRVYEAVGFRSSRTDRPFALGALRPGTPLPPLDTSRWLVDFDWTDNGLRNRFFL